MKRTATARAASSTSGASPKKILDDLVRMTARAFYNDEHVVVVDALLRARRLVKDSDLALYLNLQTKQVTAVLQQLKKDHIVKSETRSEATLHVASGRTYSNKNRYWYIDYKHFINVLRYKLYMMNKKIETELGTHFETQLYECPMCKTRYNDLDAAKILNTGTGLFQCEHCNVELKELSSAESIDRTQLKRTQLAQQLKPLVEQLKRTDGLTIPSADKSLATLQGKQFVAVTSLATLATENGENRGSLLQDLKYSIVVDIEQDDFGIRNRLNGYHSLTASVKDEKNIKLITPTAPSTSSSSTSPSVPMIDYKGQPPWMVSRWKILKQIEENRRKAEMEQLMKEEAALEDSVQSLFDVTQERNEDPVSRQTMYVRRYVQALQTQLSKHCDATRDRASSFESPMEIDHVFGNGHAQIKQEKMEEEEMGEGGVDDFFLVSVGGQQVPITHITEEDKERMTKEEYEAFYEKYVRFTEQYYAKLFATEEVKNEPHGFQISYAAPLGIFK